MELVSVRKAGMIADQKPIRIMYAIGDELLDFARVGREIIVNPREVIARRDDGVLRPVTQMICRTLKRVGLWQPSWTDNWESKEPPITEVEYLEYCREKKAILGEDKTMGFKEREMWAREGVKL